MKETAEQFFFTQAELSSVKLDSNFTVEIKRLRLTVVIGSAFID
jgi:hypothetical protein